MTTYHNGHRLLLQVMISKKIVTENEARDFYTKVCSTCNEDANPDKFTEFIATINNQLESLFMELRRGRSEDTGDVYYSLVNKAEDEHSKLATEYQPHEIEFIKSMLNMIIESENGSVSSVDLINIGMDLTKKISAQAAQELLNKLIDGGWIKENGGKAFLGSRTIIELGSYLKNKYKDHVGECMLCLDFVIMGDLCDGCGTKIHKYCAAMNFQSLPQNKRKCPKCKSEWNKALIKLDSEGPSVNGNAAGGMRDISIIPSTSSGASSQPMSNRRRGARR